MINRGKLFRDINKGQYEARLGFHISHDGDFQDRYGEKTDPWVPVKTMKRVDEFVEGHMNIFEYSFRSKSGHAYKDAEGIINFGGHSNENIHLRRKQ